MTYHAPSLIEFIEPSDGTPKSLGDYENAHAAAAHGSLTSHLTHLYLEQGAEQGSFTEQDPLQGRWTSSVNGDTPEFQFDRWFDDQSVIMFTVDAVTKLHWPTKDRSRYVETPSIRVMAQGPVGSGVWEQHDYQIAQDTNTFDPYDRMVVRRDSTHFGVDVKNALELGKLHPVKDKEAYDALRDEITQNFKDQLKDRAARIEDGTYMQPVKQAEILELRELINRLALSSESTIT